MIRDDQNQRDAVELARQVLREFNRTKRNAAKAEKRAREKAIGKRAPGQRKPRERDNAYLNFIRRQPCCVCGKAAPSQAAHIRSGYPEAGWRPTGMGEKPSDHRTLPLCPGCHVDGPKAQHKANEVSWWRSHDIYPPSLCATYRRQFEGDEA